ncbi:MAG: tyrosine-type recombinase/integrase [Dehalococcoidia bacterium]|nr:tyrosine-type recombinase/integrase [Dehalococcoidia bacterium]
MSNSAITPDLELRIQALAQQMVAALIQGKAPQTAVLENLEEGIPSWVANLKARYLSPRTIEGYEADVRRYLKRDPRPTYLSIQAYIAKRLDEVSPARVAGERKALVSFFKFLHKARLMRENPTANLDSFKVKYNERDIPSEVDVTKLLQSACFHHRDTPQFRTMTALLANTGLRLGEACSIKKGDINFEKLEIRVMGKGRKQRLVPVAPYVASVLKAWIERDGHSPWLFPAANPKGYLDERSFDKTFKRQCKRCGVKPFSPHALRHYYATATLNNGGDLHILSKILGHASIAITADLYVHVTNEQIHDTHRRYAPFADAIVEG